ncbi:hypothetical protein BTE48_02905 [Oceanospirillum multiglobuliferum]|uniref:Uncharacterized protein n=1 Tax=Oceanospirillum multiglobuliferum TaxID=64969 RepID=A0A1V4T765_9GAMM|nr:hypothetical protein BTE48_02905 [Oceanospirillum multiglobuliferum]
MAYLRAIFWPIPRLSRSLGSLFVSNKAIFYLFSDALAIVTPRTIPEVFNTLLLINSFGALVDKDSKTPDIRWMVTSI